MKIAVLGATGRTGRLVIEEALARGWDVRALARDPARLGPANPHLIVVKGEAGSAADVVSVVEGCDAVVSALGIVKGGRADICTAGTRNALAAMQQHGVRRYLVVGGAGSRAPREDKPRSGKLK
jgi:putative NADH-flavin reductase